MSEVMSKVIIKVARKVMSKATSTFARKVISKTASKKKEVKLYLVPGGSSGRSLSRFP